MKDMARMRMDNMDDEEEYPLDEDEDEYEDIPEEDDYDEEDD